MPWSRKWDWPILIALAWLVCAVSVGWRDPWPPDEPRFALVAQEMLASGNWLVPTRAGEIYPDKPPVFMWASALSQSVLGLRWGFALPSALSGMLVMLLVFDVGRRLGNRQTAWLSVFALIASAQFVIQSRSAQIDMTLTAFTTVGLYGLLRHLLLGPAWGWAWLAAVACGVGVITKGVGFLPLLMLLPWLLVRWRQSQAGPARSDPAVGSDSAVGSDTAVGSDSPAKSSKGMRLWWRWLVFALCILAPVAAWLLPLLVLAQGDSEMAAYRDEILFRQTAGRYTNAWHHREWFGYLWLHAPVLWAPLTLLLPWLIPAWWRSCLQGRPQGAAVLMLLTWVVLVLLFFSFSSGKRGVYVLPALPALALAAGLVLPAVLDRARAGVLLWWSIIVLATFGIVAAIGWRWVPKLVQHHQRIPDSSPGLVFGVCSGLLLVIAWRCGRGRPWLAALLSVLALWTVYGTWAVQIINPAKSAVPVMTALEMTVPAEQEVGLPYWREQILLHAGRPVVTFGYLGDSEARWQQARVWVAEQPQRWLMVTGGLLEKRFGGIPASAVFLGNRSRRQWYVISGAALRSELEKGSQNEV